jgi:hypothetical protein
LQWDTLAVALGPTGENGLAQLGLSTRSAETGELPRSSPVRGSSAGSGRLAASGRARRCQGASPGGKDPDLGHRRRRGSPWWARDGDTSRRLGTGDGRPEKRWRAPAWGSWSGGRCDDGGACRWSKVALDGRAASATEGCGRLGALTVACGGRWLNGRLGVAQRHTRVVWGGGCFGAWSNGVQ